MAAQPAQRDVASWSFTHNPGPVLKAFMFLSWLSATVFFWGLPYWSYLFNDKWGYGKNLCNLDAEKIVCGNTKTPYVDIAKKLHRIHGGLMGQGNYWGCSCGEGIFGDWACVVNQNEHLMVDMSPFGIDTFMSARFSVSYFITTPPATGAFAAFTFFPILFIWNFGAGNGAYEGKSCSVTFIFVTQVIFQIFFGVFLFFTLCAFPIKHDLVVVIFILSQVLHMSAVACHVGCRTPRGIFVAVACVVGIGGLAAGVIIDGLSGKPDASWFFQHAFYLGECCGLTCILGIPVILTVFFPNPKDAYETLLAQ